MPLVIPRVYVPIGVNNSNVCDLQRYDGQPDREDVERYVEWLKKELQLAEDWLTINVPDTEVKT